MSHELISWEIVDDEFGCSENEVSILGHVVVDEFLDVVGIATPNWFPAVDDEVVDVLWAGGERWGLCG